MMPDERQVETLFYEALEVPAGPERQALLDGSCAGDAPLRQRVERLLAAHGEMDDFLHPESLPQIDLGDEAGSESAPGDGALPDLHSAVPAPPALPAGTVIASRYRLIEVLGEGGMGTVYRAEQTAPLVRQVALKLIKPEVASPAVIQRFDAERQALAVMDHENIARVFDGGGTDSGDPFFVMELVPGVPINRYCDEHRLSIADRVRLFISVCEALQHAHQKGVIHRDLKPGNVLVSVSGGRAIPKVIDFGVAKAIGQPLTPADSTTAFGMVVGTPEYMSPEQARLEPIDVDTRTDVYSLGALLYELLAGRPPFGRYGIDHDSLLGMLMLIREGTPSPPSVSLRSAPDASAISAARGGIPARVARQIEKELDAIVMKCLQAARENRYATAREVADELTRFLNGQPIHARSAGPLERCARWCRHNPAIAGLVAAVFLSLLAGLSTSLFFAWTASLRAVAEAQARESERQQRERAEEQTQRARAERAVGLLQLARALRTGGRAGQRFGALRALRESLAIAGPSREHADEAASALCLPDWEPDLEWTGYPDDGEAFALAPTFDRYAVAHRDGSIDVCSLPENHPLTRFQGLGTHSDYGGLTFSENGRLLLERRDGDDPRVRCWELDGGQATLIFERFGHWASLCPDGCRLAMHVERQVQIWNLADQRLMAEIEVADFQRSLAFMWSPSGRYLVAQTAVDWRVFDAEHSFAESRHALPDIGYRPTAHPNDHWAIVAGPRDRGCVLMDLASGSQVAPAFVRHTSAGIVPVLSRDGDTVFSTDWTQTLRMWETTSGRELLLRPSSPNRNNLVVSPDNTRIGPELLSQHRVRTLRFAPGRELRLVPLGKTESPQIIGDFHRFHHLDATGSLLAVTTRQGIALVDTNAGVTVVQLPANRPSSLQATGFLQDQSLVTYGREGLQIWPITLDTAGGTLSIGEPDRSLSGWRAALPFDSHVAADGSLIALQAEIINGETTLGAACIHTGRRPDLPANHFAIARGLDVKSVSVSPDARFVATGVWSGSPTEGQTPAMVWDPQGQVVAALPSLGLCRVKFSPRGNRLLVHSSTNFECHVYRSADWSLDCRIPVRFLPIFSPDETLCAFSGDTGEISLRDGETLAEFAVLHAPFDEPLVPIAIAPGNVALYAATTESRVLYRFDLARIRRGLDDLDLGTFWPGIPPTADTAGRPPLRLRPGSLFSRDPENPAEIQKSVR
ncbi:MAG: protein kinase [Planctomycetes bacterium]|nr:protein kinase [Planctomycetota bacterium]